MSVESLHQFSVSSKRWTVNRCLCNIHAEHALRSWFWFINYLFYYSLLFYIIIFCYIILYIYFVLLLLLFFETWHSNISDYTNCIYFVHAADSEIIFTPQTAKICSCCRPRKYVHAKAFCTIKVRYYIDRGERFMEISITICYIKSW